MKYLGGSFSVYNGGSKAYRDNYDRIFPKKEKPAPKFDDVDEPKEIPLPPPELLEPKKKAKKKSKKKRKLSMLSEMDRATNNSEQGFQKALDEERYPPITDDEE